MDNVCNHCLFSIPSKVEMAEEQEYLRWNTDNLESTEEAHCITEAAEKVLKKYEVNPQLM